MMSRKYLIGGHSIGIVLQTHGAAVVGFSPVQGQDGKQDSPAKTAGLLVGDFITKVNDTNVTTDDEIGQLIDELGENGQTVTLTVKRESDELKIPVIPKKCQETDTWRVGLYIRDSTAGVGTLTFYEPQSQIYGALRCV